MTPAGGFGSTCCADTGHQATRLLPEEQNTELGRWQHQHLRLTWHAAPEPWLLESTVIARAAAHASGITFRRLCGCLVSAYSVCRISPLPEPGA